MEFIIEYKVRADKADEAGALRDRFFEALGRAADPEVRYRSLSRPDGISFVHLAWFADQDALERFQSTPHFKEFSTSLPGLCESGPDASPIAERHSVGVS